MRMRRGGLSRTCLRRSGPGWTCAAPPSSGRSCRRSRVIRARRCRRPFSRPRGAPTCRSGTRYIGPPTPCPGSGRCTRPPRNRPGCRSRPCRYYTPTRRLRNTVLSTDSLPWKAFGIPEIPGTRSLFQRKGSCPGFPSSDLPVREVNPYSGPPVAGPELTSRPCLL